MEAFTMIENGMANIGLMNSFARRFAFGTLFTFVTLTLTRPSAFYDSAGKPYEMGGGGNGKVLVDYRVASLLGGVAMILIF